MSNITDKELQIQKNYHKNYFKLIGISIFFTKNGYLNNEEINN